MPARTAVAVAASAFRGNVFESHSKQQRPSPTHHSRYLSLSACSHFSLRLRRRSCGLDRINVSSLTAAQQLSSSNDSTRPLLFRGKEFEAATVIYQRHRRYAFGHQMGFRRKMHSCNVRPSPLRPTAFEAIDDVPPPSHDAHFQKESGSRGTNNIQGLGSCTMESLSMMIVSVDRPQLSYSMDGRAYLAKDASSPRG